VFFDAEFLVPRSSVSLYHPSFTSFLLKTKQTWQTGLFFGLLQGDFCPKHKFNKAALFVSSFDIVVVFSSNILLNV